MEEIVAIVPARGGSKRIPRKNLVLLRGKPLLGYTLDTARRSSLFSRVIVSSEDEGILDLARREGAQGLARPVSLAADDTPSVQVVCHALETLRVPPAALVVLLQPTSPLRSVYDVEEGIRRFRRCEKRGGRSLVSVRSIAAASEAQPGPHADWRYLLYPDGLLSAYTEGLPGGLPPLPSARLTELNGALYIARAGEILKGRSLLLSPLFGYEMPEYRSVDIDTLADLERASYDLQSPCGEPCCETSA
jgi:N-acylneuraminate cytidylyltransferase